MRGSSCTRVLQKSQCEHRAAGSLHVTAYECTRSQSQSQSQTVLPDPVFKCARRWPSIRGWGVSSNHTPFFYTCGMTEKPAAFTLSLFVYVFYGRGHCWLVRINVVILTALYFLYCKGGLYHPRLPSPTPRRWSAHALFTCSSILLVSFLSKLNSLSLTLTLHITLLATLSLMKKWKGKHF